MPSPQSLTIETQPHSTEAERTVIGAMLIDPESIVRLVDWLQPEDFYDPVYRSIYSCICELHTSGQVIDFVTVTNKLSDNKRLQEIGGSAFLAKLSSEVPTSSHVQNYAGIVRDKSKRRKMIATGQFITGLGYDEDTKLSNHMEAVENELLQLTSTSTDQKPQQLGSLNTERYDRYSTLIESDNPAEHCGIRTGFNDLDLYISGLKPGNVMVIAGQTSTGKTAIALEIARRVSLDQRKTVALFSLEMSKEELYDRFYASVLEVEEARLSKGDLEPDEITRMGSVLETFTKTPLFLDDDADKSLANLRSKARQLKVREGIDLLIIDYIQLIAVPEYLARQTRHEQLREISGSIKGLAREIGCPVIVLAQLNRNFNQRPDKEPQLSDIRDTSSIEQDADFVLMPHRASLYAPNPDEHEDRDITDLFLRKNRPHGKLGHFRLRFDSQKNRYYALDKHHTSPMPEQASAELTEPVA